MSNSSPSMLKPALIGGTLFGIVGGIPYLNMVNCACCALVVGGGFLAAYFYSQECGNVGAPFSPGKGAVVGLVAAVFYALASSVVGGIAQAITGPPDIDQIVGRMEDAGAPAEMVDMMTTFMESGGGFIGILIGFFFLLVIGAIFSTVGGAIGGAVFKVEAPSAAAGGPAPPPPPAPSGGAPAGGGGTEGS